MIYDDSNEVIMHKVKFVNDISRIKYIKTAEAAALNRVTAKFRFRANDYYLSLINWDDPDDPIRKIIIPSLDELEEWGTFDVSEESTNYKVKGLQHKYEDTALLILNRTCGSLCRFCFRKRIFLPDNMEIINNVDHAIKYVMQTPSITNVLLTGGEPFILGTPRLQKIVNKICSIPHVKIIRFGTKIPVFNPYRIIDDPDLPQMIREAINSGIQVYVMCHINHPKELSFQAKEAVEVLKSAGAVMCNQTPMLRGINADAAVLRELFEELSFLGIAPYYVFVNRPTIGNKPFCLPITEAYKIFTNATRGLSGIARRAKLVMSHASGKIQVAGLTDRHIFLRYNRARDVNNEYNMMVFQRDDKALWFDDLINRIE